MTWQPTFRKEICFFCILPPISPSSLISCIFFFLKKNQDVEREKMVRRRVGKCIVSSLFRKTLSIPYRADIDDMAAYI